MTRAVILGVLEIEKEIVREVAQGDKQHLKQSALQIAKHKSEKGVRFTH